MWRRNQSTVKLHRTSSSSSPSSPFSFSTFKDIQDLCTEDSSPPVKKPSNIFHRVRIANSVLRSLTVPRPKPEPGPAPNADPIKIIYNNSSRTSLPSRASFSFPAVSIPGAEKRIVVYFTSLRVVRSTFEDCRTVRSILRGFRVSLDERDLAMDPCFINELQQIFSSESQNKKLSLHKIFIGKRCMEGVEER